MSICNIRLTSLCEFMHIKVAYVLGVFWTHEDLQRTVLRKNFSDAFVKLYFASEILTVSDSYCLMVHDSLIL